MGLRRPLEGQSGGGADLRRARLTVALADRYRVERELGRGGMARVYLADDLRHQRSVAIKVLNPELAITLGPKRFLREIEVTAQLDHPMILPLLDSGEVNGTLYYVMPFVEGESLRDRLDRDQQLPLEEALQITNDVAEALGHAHSRGVIHRDIKPENILLERGHALVADFGVAKAVRAAGAEKTEQLTATGVSLGTPEYMSPEQAAATKPVDARSDLYSLGCVLYEMLAGRPPFVATLPHELMARHARDPVPPLQIVRSTLPDPIAAAVEKALAKDPADRFATAQQFSAALTGEASVQPTPVGVAPRRLALSVWQRAGLAALAILIVGVLMGPCF
jgi:serine/threonine-protein kinase